MKSIQKLLSGIIIVGISVFLATVSSFAQDLKINDERWAESFYLGGNDQEVLSFAKDEMGNVYVGGAFTHFNGVAANGIVMWDGEKWNGLNGGLSSSNYGATVHSIVLIDNQVYVGGQFTTAGDVEVRNIARWDGEQWHALAGGVDGSVYAMASDNSNNLIVGGWGISQADTVVVRNLAKWDGSTWSAMNLGLETKEVVNAIVVKNDTIYVGGAFTIEGDDPINHIMFWDGDNWNSMENGMNQRVYSLAFKNGVLYAGGKFTMAGDKTVNYLAEWNGSEWKDKDSGLDNYVYSLALDGNDLYIGGRFTSINGKDFIRFAKWDGDSWQGYGQGFDSDVLALLVIGDEIYAGGEFEFVNGKKQAHFAHWNGYKWDDSWILQDQSVNGTVNAIIKEGDDVFVGGVFLMAGGDTVNNIAKWDGHSWTALGEGLSGGQVKAMAYHKGKLYVGGTFSRSGEKGLYHIAAWDGYQWDSLSSQGINNQVYALAFHGDTLYAGGNFTKAGDKGARRVAKWDGTEWHAIGGDGSLGGAGGLDGYISSYVSSISVENDTVYFGGYFGRAYSQEEDGSQTYVNVKSVAKWDGSTWYAAPRFDDLLIGQIINDLFVKDGVIYAAGKFPIFREYDACKIVKLVDGEWLDIGERFHHSGTDSWGNEITSILEVEGNLFAAMESDLVGESPTNHIVWWNGSEWVSLGSGVNTRAYALASDNEYLYVGGLFTFAGGKTAHKLSSYYLEEFKDILSFSFNGLNPVVNASIEGKNIEAVIPTGTDITALVPSIVVSESATVSPASGVAQDFSEPVIYTVTASDGTRKEYTLTIIPPSNEKELISFEFENYYPIVKASITGTNVEVVLPPGVDITGLVPTTIEVSESATVSPAEGVAQDFTSPVVYTVNAEDGTSKEYTVSITVLLSDEKEMLSFSLENLSPVVNAIITDTNVEVSVPTGTDITQLIPTIEVSDLATVSPGSGVVQDFSSPLVYTITAQDGTTKEYTVTVSVVLSGANDIVSFAFEAFDPSISASVIGIEVTAVVPLNTDVSGLVPSIEISELATVNPASGAVQDFSSPVVYTVTAENGDKKTYNVGVEISTGSPAVKAEAHFIIYPNPANNFIYLNSAQTVEIFSAKGIMIKSIENAQHIHISDLNPGVYFIRNPDGIVKKFIVQ